jgi:nucleotide-binding universal stress UspA family protein
LFVGAHSGMEVCLYGSQIADCSSLKLIIRHPWKKRKDLLTRLGRDLTIDTKLVKIVSYVFIHTHAFNREKEDPMLPRKIMFCADFSENSEPAFRVALEYAKAFGSELILVHIVDAGSFPVYVDWVGVEMERIIARTGELAEERLAKLLEERCGDIPAARAICRSGPPAQEIAAVASEENVDLIVVGTHGRTGVKHLVMGSIARSVLRIAHRPTLIVEGPPEESEGEIPGPPVP